jgi:hypothetical protein
MAKLAWIVVPCAMLTVATAALAETAVPDMRGTWKGKSESIVQGAGNTHHASPKPVSPRLNSIEFTMVVKEQDGRRFSGTFSSARGNDPVIAVISRNGSIFMVDDDGYTVGSVLAPNRIELCYMQLSPKSRVASCTEMTKEP